MKFIMFQLKNITSSRMVFPVSHLASQLSATGILVFWGVAGQAAMAAQLGIAQGAALALFLSLSGNVRSLIFRSGSGTVIRKSLLMRLGLALPLAAGTWFLARDLGGVGPLLAGAVAVRKAVEWLTEIHHCEIELRKNFQLAWSFLGLQCGLLLTAALAPFLPAQLFACCLIAWAVLPVFPSVPFLLSVLRSPSRGEKMPWRDFWPHLGSSTIIGTTVYVFRMAVLSLAGAEAAGRLFAAFAIGGLPASLFSHGMGASLALAEQKGESRRITQWLNRIFAGLAMVGILVLLLPGVVAGLSGGTPFTELANLFWQALGFSLLGGVVSVFAQQQRIRDLQHGTLRDVFAPDVLANLGIMVFVPAIFFLFGLKGMTWLYLLNAITGWILYRTMDPARHARWVTGSMERPILWLFALFALLPLFFIWAEGIFSTSSRVYDSGGSLDHLPVPLNLLVFLAAVPLLGNYQRANLATGFLFALFLAVALSLMAPHGKPQGNSSAGFFLMLQYILPAAAMVAGMLYGSRRGATNIFFKAGMMVFGVLLPILILLGLWQGEGLPARNLLAFSIYQPESLAWIVPAIWVAAACYLERTRLAEILLAWLGLCSGTFLTYAGNPTACLFGLLTLIVAWFLMPESRPRFILLVILFVAGSALFWLGRSLPPLPDFSPGLTETGGIEAGFWGAREMLTREESLSIHNYYLGAWLHFGVPFLGVFLFFLVLTATRAKKILKAAGGAKIAGLLAAVFFLLLVGNLQEPMLKQLYPGILTFFLWGLLLSHEPIPEPS